MTDSDSSTCPDNSRTTKNRMKIGDDTTVMSAASSRSGRTQATDVSMLSISSVHSSDLTESGSTHTSSISDQIRNWGKDASITEQHHNSIRQAMDQEEKDIRDMLASIQSPPDHVAPTFNADREDCEYCDTTATASHSSSDANILEVLQSRLNDDNDHFFPYMED